ncbi:MAG: hypothetical protein HN341_15110 [Verrucomicrobia bacterium]|jgi:hypothetical protein|nr:hypothetical protein [Verrucomicrobiota bacterium]
MDNSTDNGTAPETPPEATSAAPASDSGGGKKEAPSAVFCEKVRNILPDAVAGSLTDDDRLANALYPTVERSLTRSVKKDSRPLVDAMFPILGPMIRRNIAETMRGMVQSLNRALEYTFSVRGLKWRWEAFISGKPFAEVVMLHSLVYRVEQVFLIHKETGLLLLHVAADHIADQSSKENMVSAMLTAIQDFVSDSFDTEANSQLSSIQMGDLNVWLEQGPDVVVAGVVRGDLPVTVQTQLRETTERVQSEMQDALTNFNGDVTPFERRRFDLESCLKEQFNERMRLIPLTWVILIAPVLGFLWWAGLSTTENWQWNKYLRAVRSEPGLIVIEEGQRDGDFYIIGMRDPLAADPGALLKKQPIIAHQVEGQWIPYQSLQEDFVLKRAIARLTPPDSVTLRLKQGCLSAAGTASDEWIAAFERAALNLPGVSAADTSKLKHADAPTIAAWNDCLRRLRTSPGIFVTRVEKEGLTFKLEGLRDPSALDPSVVIADYPELKGRVEMHWTAYYAVVPGFILKRAEAILTPPESVTLEVSQDNELRIAGHASRSWIERTRIVAPTIAGVGSIDETELHDMDGPRYKEWNRYLTLLDEAAGLDVIESGERNGRFHLIGFQDPIGLDPYSILETVGLNRGDVQAKWLPSPESSKRFLLAHAQRVLAPPPSVTLQRMEDELVATGSAPHSWIRDAMIIARCLPGITALDASLLVDEDEQAQEQLRYKIERTLIVCRLGTAIPATGQESVIEELVSAINALHATALKLDTDVTIAVTGESDGSTTGGVRLALAKRRAAAFTDALVNRGVPARLLVQETSTTKEKAEGVAGAVGFSRKRGIAFRVRTVRPSTE